MCEQKSNHNSDKQELARLSISKPKKESTENEVYGWGVN